MANEIEGALSHLAMYDEATWNTIPGTPTYYNIPVTDYGVEMATEVRQGNPYIGLMQRKHSKRYKGLPSGSIAGPLGAWHQNSKSLAEFIIDWAFSDGDEDSAFPISKGAEWAEGPDTSNRGHNGLRVNSATITGSEDNGLFDFSLDVLGGSEAPVVTAQTIPADWDKLVDFEFADAVLTVDAGAIAISNVSLQIQRGLKPKYLNNRSPAFLVNTQRIVTMSFELVKNADTYHASVRALTVDKEYDIQLLLTGVHNGSGASGDNTTVLADMPRCSLVNADDARSIEDLTMTTINVVALKPDTSEDDLNWTFGLT